MMKRFLSKKDFEDEEYGPLQYGLQRHKHQDSSFEDGEESEKEKEGYFPQENENDGLDSRGRWVHDREYGYPYEYNPRYHGRNGGYDYDKYNQDLDVGSSGEPKEGDKAAPKEGEKKEEKKGGIPPELEVKKKASKVQKKRVATVEDDDDQEDMPMLAQKSKSKSKPKKKRLHKKKQLKKKTAVKKPKRVVKEESDDDEDDELDDGVYSADGAIAQAVEQKQRMDEDAE
jgi:hypothetical protein